MRLLIIAASLLLAPVAHASPVADVVRPIHQFIDGFNKGDTAAGLAAYASGDLAIIDEFAPHVWTGPKAAQNWAADYGKHDTADGITDGIVKYAKAKRVEINGDVAYSIVPTVYTYKQKNVAMAEEGQMTFALRHGKAGWKIAGWTWSGVTPHPAK